MTCRTALALPRANWPATPAPLTADQTRFLILHARTVDPPMTWRWYFGSNLLRASTERGHRASISATGFAELVRAGLMKSGPGCADAIITEAGRRAAI